jgi:hypothetical protein
MSEDHPGTEAGRVSWWAVLRTERDCRLALARGRPITGRNLGRFLMRRLSGVTRPGAGLTGQEYGKEWIMSDFDILFAELTGNSPYRV